MKKIFILILIAGIIGTLQADTFDSLCGRFGAKPGSDFHRSMMAAKAQSEKVIYNNLLQDVNAIVWKFAAVGQGNSAACSNYVASFLQIVGTPIALQLLNDLKNGKASFKRLD